ncbi:hypothetical protein ACFL0Q_07515 [Thermodesulfobacteriota bacterium]
MLGSDFTAKTNAPANHALAESMQARVLLESHDYGKAMAHFGKAISILEDSKAQQFELEFNRILLALAMVQNGDKRIELKPLFDYASENRVKYLDGWMHKFIGMILLNIDDQHLDEAENWIKKAIEADDANGMRWGLGQDYAYNAKVLERKGDLPKAREMMTKAFTGEFECSRQDPGRYSQPGSEESRHSQSVRNRLP